MHVAFYLAGEITQVIDSIPWVRCASGNVYHEDGGVKTRSQGLLIKLIVRLVWRVVNHLGEDLTEEVVEETNQEDSWTPDGQVWR